MKKIVLLLCLAVGLSSCSQSVSRQRVYAKYRYVGEILPSTTDDYAYYIRTPSNIIFVRNNGSGNPAYLDDTEIVLFDLTKPIER